MSDLVRFSVSMPADLAETFDRYVSARGYANRSEAVRDVMRDFLVEQQWANDEAEVAGTVTLVYDHHRSDLAQTLTNLQHRHHHMIQCSTHVHMDADHCLEIIVVRGPAAQVRAIADLLIATRGVMHGRLVCSTTGHGIP